MIRSIFAALLEINIVLILKFPKVVKVAVAVSKGEEES